MIKRLFGTLILLMSFSLIQAQNWIKFNNHDGAFSVQLPTKPNDLTKDVEVEFEEMNKVKVHIYTSLDEKAKMNYLVAYNDYPLGYIVEDKEETLNQLIDQIKEENEIISIEDIMLDGNTGKKVILKLQKNYFSEMVVYARGNRIYKLIAQNIDAKATEIVPSNFFKSFVFEKYTAATLKEFVPDEEYFAFKTFQKPKIDKNEEIDYKSFLIAINTFKCKNTKSGGAYLLEECAFSPYYEMPSLDSFYNSYRNALVTYNDSLMYSEFITVDGKRAIEFMTNSGTNYNKYMLVVDNGKCYVISGYSTLEDLQSEDAKTFFNSFRIIKQDPAYVNYNLISNKTSLLMNDIKSADPEKMAIAKGALNFFVIDSIDVPAVCKALESSYADDEESDGIRRLLLEDLQMMNHPSLVEFYNDLYKKENTVDAVKEKLLVCMAYAESDKGTTYYINNLFNAPPNELVHDNWNFFGPFNDSLALTIQYFDKLKAFIDKPSYRSSLLSLTEKLTNSEAGLTIIQKNEAVIFNYVNADLNDFVAELKTNEYAYKGEIYNYLTLLSFYKSPSIAKWFTDKLAKSKAQSWVKDEAIKVRIFNGLKVKKKVKNKMLKDLDLRYGMLVLYERMGKLNEVPAQYLTNDALAQLIIRNYFTDEEPPSEIKVLGTVEHNGKTIYVMSTSYGEAWDKTIGLVGNFSAGSKQGIKDLKAYSDWANVEEDWKAQATKMLSDFDEFAY